MAGRCSRASALISSAYEGDERAFAFAFGVRAAIGAVAATVGPLLGGFLTTFLSWRGGFGLEAVIVVVLFSYSGQLTEAPPTIGWNQVDVGKYDAIREVDYVEGSCFLVKAEVIDKVGLLDPMFFAYWEDIDWCVRGRRADARDTNPFMSPQRRVAQIVCL